MSETRAELSLAARWGRWKRTVRVAWGRWWHRLLDSLVFRLQLLILSAYKSSEALRLVRRVRRESGLAVTAEEAVLIHSLAASQTQVEGEMAEVGVYRGGTAKLICEAKGGVPLHLFDTFDGLPEPGEEDWRIFEKGALKGDLADVQRYLADYREVYFHRGLFPATAESLTDRRFSFVHVDVDLYQSTRACLEFFYPRLSPGGILLSHDFHFPSVRKAFVDTGLVDQAVGLADSQCMLVKR